MRIAQEIQRKLEELDVKLKTLEAKGVEVEKKLRGEGNKYTVDIPSKYFYCKKYMIWCRVDFFNYFTFCFSLFYYLTLITKF